MPDNQTLVPEEHGVHVDHQNTKHQGRQGQRKPSSRRQDTSRSPPSSGKSSPQNPRPPWVYTSPTSSPRKRTASASADAQQSHPQKHSKAAKRESPTADLEEKVEKLDVSSFPTVAQSKSIAPYVRIPKNKTIPASSAGKPTAADKSSKSASVLTTNTFAKTVDESIADKSTKNLREAGLSAQSQSPSSRGGQPKQPFIQQISLEQLAEEIKAIYRGLCVVETKLYVVITEHNDKFDEMNERGEIPDDKDDIWPTFIGLTRTYLHEQNDFFLASQHPVASPVLQGLAAKYNMPARLWKWGIHSPLELMRRRLPSSREWMMTFWTIGYQMLGLLLETVPEFETIWLECLGDLSRYKMAIEDTDSGERDHYAEVAYDWYSRTADLQPGVGRVFHHQAVLCRRQPLRQLGLYCLALTSTYPFLSAHESMGTLFRSALDWPMEGPTDSIHTWVTRACAALFENKSVFKARQAVEKCETKMREAVQKEKKDFRATGLWMAFVWIACLHEFGIPDNKFKKAFMANPKDNTSSKETGASTTSLQHLSKESFDIARYAFISCFKIALELGTNGDLNVLPMLNVFIVFIYQVALVNVDDAILAQIPWVEYVNFVNSIANSFDKDVRQEIIDNSKFPYSHAADTQKDRDAKEHVMLQEDHLLNGKVFRPKDYWPLNHLESATAMMDTRFVENNEKKYAEYRRARMTYTTHRMAMQTTRIRWDSQVYCVC